MCVVLGVRDDRESGNSSVEVDLSSIQRTHIVGASPCSGSGANGSNTTRSARVSSGRRGNDGRRCSRDHAP